MIFITKEIPDEIKNSSGIYCIRNNSNNKVYIGKTVNFRRRYDKYKCSYKSRDKRQINPHLLNALDKYGPKNFTFSILEVCSIEVLAERELYWMVEYESTNRALGYNLRLDSSTGMIAHQETREKISKRIKREFEDGTRSREKVSEFTKEMWKDEDKKNKMRHAVSESRRSYFIQSQLCNTVVAVWNGINQILNHHPDYKWQNIYAACNGSKPSYRGFKWQRVADVEESIRHLIVEGSGELKPRETCEKSLYEYSGLCRGGLYLYEIDDGQTVVKMLGKDIQKVYPNAYSAFHRHKSNTIKHKGVIITRYKIDEESYTPST